MRFGFFIVLFVAAMQLAGAPAYVHRVPGGERWAVGNDFVERTISFSAQQGLRTDAFVYKVTGTDVARYGRERGQVGREFRFDVNGRAMDGRSGFTFVDSKTAAIPGGSALTITLRGRSEPVEVSVTYAVYNEHPALRKWIAVRNTGNADLSLTHLCFEDLQAGPGTPSELEVAAGYGAIPRELFMTGRASDAAIFIRNVRNGEGFAIVNEAPGYSKRTEVGESWREGISVLYDTDLFPFERTVKPSETFESAKSSIVFFQDGHGLSDPRWTVPSYMSKVVMRRGTRFRPIWLYNTWEPFQRTINQQITDQLIPVAARMGIDVFTIDDGWQAAYGSNEDNRRSFPDGLDHVAAQLQANKMGLGLWVPLAAISTQSNDFRQHPEWVCRDREERPKLTGTASGQQAVMCLGSGYRDVALQRLEDLIVRYRPRYIKVDLTTVFNAYGESPGCYAQGHWHKTWAESLERIYESLEHIGARLYATHPEVTVDYTFELWGEKHLIDAALLGCADVDWLSNVDDATFIDAGPIQARTLLYQRALSVPSESMLIGNLHAETGPTEDRLGVALGSGPILLGDLRKLTNSQVEQYRHLSSWYKELRSRVSLLDSFFPLGSWREPQASQWDGFARFSRSSDGIAVLFRNGSGSVNASLRIPVPQGAVYQARSVVDGRSLGRVTSGDLQSGWQVPFDLTHAITVLEFRRE
jgi:alpha-galactosidase